MFATSATGKDLATAIPRIKFSGIAWTDDSEGFFYSRFKGTERSADFATAGQYHQVWYHRIGASGNDRLVFERPEHPGDLASAAISDDGRWLYLFTSSGTTNNRLWIADLGTPSDPDLGAKPQVMATEEDAIHVPLGVVGRTVYLYTTYQAAKGRIVAATVGESDRAKWRTVVPEAKDPISDAGAILVGDRLVVPYLVDVQSRVRLFSLDGKPQGEIDLPEVGSVLQLAGRNDGRDVYLAFTSFLRPTTVYRYSLPKSDLQAFYAPRTAFDASQYETRALFFPSKDGTQIPIFVTLRKGAHAGWNAPDDAVWLWWVQCGNEADLFVRSGRLAGTWRYLCRGQSPRRQ